MRNNRFIKTTRRNKGFTLVELILTLAVISIISFTTFQSMNRNFEDQQADAFGDQIRNIGDSVNNYIVNHYDVLSKLTNSTGGTQDPGPRTCSTATSTCEITTQTLVNEGMLPPGYINKNVYGSGYKIIISRKGTSPYWNISALITTDNSLTLSGKIRYDLLGKAMQSAGIDSGMTRTASNKVDGYKGTWSATQTDYSNINKQGLLAYIAGYGSNSYSAFLRRDGTLPMTGDLNMGTKNIYNAANITATGKGTFGGEVVAGSWIKAKNGYGDTIGIGGDGGGDDYEINLSNPNRRITVYSAAGPTKLTVTGVLTADQSLVSNDQLTVKNHGQFGGRITTNGLNSTDYPAGWGGGVRTNDVYAGGTIAAGTNKQANAYLNSAGDVRANRNISAGGTITASGNINSSADMNSNRVYSNYIKSNGNIDAAGNIASTGTITSNKRLTTGEFLQLNAVASAGAGCSPNGLQGRDSSGAILSCVNGRWASAAIGEVIRTNGVNRCGGDGRLPSIAVCPAGYKLTGGGYSLTQWRDDDGRNAPDGSFPDVANNRFIVNPPGGNDAGCFTAYAVCVR